MGIFILPNGYSAISTINLQQEKKKSMFINAGVIVIMVALFCAGIAIAPLRLGNFLARIATCISLVVYLIVHELVHGFFIKRISGKKASHRFAGLFVLTGSEAYFTRSQYRIIAFAPVIFFGIALLLLNIALPQDWFWRIYLIQIANLSMSFGDIYIAGFLLGKFDGDVLIRGEGVTITIYSQK